MKRYEEAKMKVYAVESNIVVSRVNKKFQNILTKLGRGEGSRALGCDSNMPLLRNNK